MKTLRAETYKVGDVLNIDRQQAQVCDLSDEDYLRWQGFMPAGDAWSFFAGKRMVACGGLRPLRAGVMEAWALIGQPRLAEWGALITQAKAALALHPARRIQAVAFCDHDRAPATLDRLGFVFEGIMRAYGPDGRDVALFARVK